jgi:TPR repeat protein
MLTNTLTNTRNLVWQRRIIVLCLSVLLLPACTTVPVTSTKARPAISSEQQQQIYRQAKTLFLDKNYNEAARLLLPLARQGHLEAQYAVGYMYHYGYGLPHNEKESTRWITLAAARGNPKAKEALALINAAHDQGGLTVVPAPTP